LVSIFNLGNGVSKVPSSIPKKRQELLQWNGWGFKDSGFVVQQKGTKENPKYELAFTGNRYELGNGLELPYFYEWVFNNMGIVATNRKFPNPEPTSFPTPIINEGLSR